MTTLSTAPSLVSPAAPEPRIVFRGVGYDVYEALARALPQQTPTKLAYDGKDLEIMVKGIVHDDFARLLDHFITVVAHELGVPHKGAGETTWIRPQPCRGVEADQCYFFDQDKLAIVRAGLARRDNDVSSYPNPDLAVEVDISRTEVDREGIYASLNVAELWILTGGVVTILRLGPDGAYHDAGRSAWLPVLAEDVRRWVVDEETFDMMAWGERVRAWARGRKTGI